MPPPAEKNDFASVTLPFSKSGQFYRADIDGLRAVAIISVVAYHAGIWPFTGGFVGVDIFFVISGYLITAHIDSEVSARRFSFAAFYARRAKRILPALIAMLIPLYVLSFLILTPHEIKKFAYSAVTTLVGASNIYFWFSSNYFSPDASQNPLLMTWSLGVEEQFYLLLPIVLIMTFKVLRSRTLATIVVITSLSLAFSIVEVHSRPTLAFYLLPARAWEMGFGSCLAIYEARYALSSRRWVSEACAALGAAFIVFAIVHFTEATSFPGESAMLPVAGATLMIAARHGFINRVILSTKPLVGIGLVSYSWYLWHWPVLSFARVVSDKPLSSTKATLMILLALVIATGSYVCIERPFRRTTRSTNVLLLRYGAAVMAAMAPMVVLVALKGLPQRFSPAVAALNKANDEVTHESCLTGYGSSRLDTSVVCEPTGGKGPGIALIGDSHAASLSSGLRYWAEKSGYELHTLTKSSCPALATLTRYMPNHPGHDQECAKFGANALDYIKAQNNIQTVVIAGFWSAPMREANLGARYIRPSEDGSTKAASDNVKELADGLTNEVRLLEAMGKTVIVFRDVPLLDFDPIRRMLQTEIPLRGRMADFIDLNNKGSEKDPDAQTAPYATDPANNILGDVIRTQPNVTQINPEDILCKGGECSYASRDGALYVDYQHLSTLGARLVANYAINEITKAK